MELNWIIPKDLKSQITDIAKKKEDVLNIQENIKQKNWSIPKILDNQISFLQTVSENSKSMYF